MFLVRYMYDGSFKHRFLECVDNSDQLRDCLDHFYRIAMSRPWESFSFSVLFVDSKEVLSDEEV